VTLLTRQVHEPTYATEACGETFFLATPTGTRTGLAGAPFGVSHLGVLRRAPGSRTPCFLVPNQARSPCRRTRCARVWQSAHSRLTTLRPSSPGLLQCPRRLRPAAAVTVDFRLHLTCSGVVNVVPSPYPLAGTKPGCGESNPDLRFWRPPCFRNTSPEFRTKSDPAVPFSVTANLPGSQRSEQPLFLGSSGSLRSLPRRFVVLRRLSGSATGRLSTPFGGRRIRPAGGAGDATPCRKAA